MFEHICFEKTAARRRTNLANHLPLEPPQDNYHLEINEEKKSRKWIEKYSFSLSYLFHVEKNQKKKKEEIVWFLDICHQIFKTTVIVSN